ncbi:hypothetical protein SKAU_G00115760 [Synaphobranchus kaupii]|uniref:Uncharacterized protein n=1 Tax=Synaphobranchus kaupii TaxID=118154 RepID=A0A9Q1FN54_SYNKA|nr:hypothetical protein SKAU_G00115760 [Synaphobranchus kaupii]
MPKRKKTSLSASRDAKRKRLARANESPDKSAERREQSRQRMRLTRSLELPEATGKSHEKSRQWKSTKRTRPKDKTWRRAWTAPQEVSHVLPFDTPKMDFVLIFGNAVMFPWEKSFSACCNYGRIQLKPFKDPPPTLRSLSEQNTQQSRQFLENIRQYNGLVSMASKKVSSKVVQFKGHGPKPFKMSGQMYHLTPSAENNTGEPVAVNEITRD